MSRGALLGSIVLAGCCLASAAQVPDKTKGPTDEEVKKITDAAPAQPAVRPARPRKLLVYSVSWGYWHTAIPYGKKAAEILGTKTGAFQAVVSDDPAMFEPERLAEFDAAFFNNTNNEIFLPENFEKLPAEEKQKAAARDEALKKSFVAWLASGKGLAVLHAGVASFRQWPEYGNIVGARFVNHPWGAGSTVTLKIDDPDHPLARAYRNRPLTVTDEIYQVTDPYSRERLRVILSLDVAKTDMTVKGIQRKDNDFAMSWVKDYGQGRVFYFALGHQHDLYWNAAFLEHLLGGLQFALGDLKADTTPSARK